MYIEMRMRWTTKFESQNICKSSSLAVWYWMLWICSIHSSQHATHRGNLSRLWSPLSKESPHQIVEGGRGRLTGTRDEKGLLQLLYMGLRNTQQSKWEQQTENNAFLDTVFESQSKSRLGIALDISSNAYKVMSLPFMVILF